MVGSASRREADTEGLDAYGLEKVELHLVVEGERDDLPVYCTRCPKFRVQGRAIPDRLVLTPEEAGLEGAEIHWIELLPSDDLTSWTRLRRSEGDGRWTLPVLELSADADVPEVRRAYGTARFAAAVEIPPPGKSPRVLGSPGWYASPTDADPERAPGYRVTRSVGVTLPDRAWGFARLPVREGLPDVYAREKVALRPIDLVLAAYEDLAGGPLPGSRADSLAGPGWSWLFETIEKGVHRRAGAKAAAVAARGRPVPWRRRDPARGIRRGDVFVVDGATYVLPVADDGDGWLSEGDRVLHTTTGRVREGTLHEVPGTRLQFLRPRDFSEFARHLVEGGYGPIRQVVRYGPELLQACREFQRDQGLPVTGIPDEATRTALEEFLARLRSPDAPGSDTSP